VPRRKAENDVVDPTRRTFAVGALAFFLLNGSFALRPVAKQAPPAAEARVDINRATMEELLKIPGMTRTWAARIVRFRPYRGKNELLDRGVVSGEVYGRIKDYVVAHRGER
jgi:DNA uptake protein ComE-like DNA-binding protein